MTHAIRRLVLCLLSGILCLMVGRQASATAWTICPGSSITLGTSNGRNQHPEVAYAFWEGASNPKFSNGTNNPSRTQFIGMMQSLINNGQYWAELDQYGTYGGASGSIAPPRLAPYAALYTGSINGNSPGPQTFFRNDVVTFINQTIAAGYFPHPQNNDNVIYTVITTNGSQLADCGGPGQPASCCNWPAQYTDGTSYVASTCEDPAGTAHELVEGIVGYELTAGNGNGQIVDPCGCHVELVNSWSVAAYWTARSNECLVPESWGDLMWTRGQFGWTFPSGGFNMRQGYAGAGGVVATDATEQGSAGNNVHFFNSSNSTWSQIGQGGSKYAAGGGIIAGIAMDPKYGIFYYRISNGTWTGIGGPNGGPPTDVTVTSAGIIVATDVDANPWYYNPSSPGWFEIAGSGDQFIASNGSVLALNPTHNAGFVWYGPGYGFDYISSTSTTQIIASPDTNSWGSTAPGSNVMFQGLGCTFGCNAGTGRQFVSSNAVYANYGFIENNSDIYACYGTGCDYENNDVYTGFYGGWLMGGNELYATACTSQMNYTPPCVNH
jgi:hypothetical protein